jgi:hypothetical protein
MTVIAVLASPPREGLVLPELPATAPVTATEAADLYAAALRDVVTAVAKSGGDLIVNYRPDDSLPDEHVREESAEAAVRAVVADVLESLEGEDVRFEVQVGSTYDARVGNTVTHLLREEEARTAAVVPATAAFLTRSDVDSAAMKLRTAGAVLGPAPEGRVYYAGFADPVDFEDAFAPPSLETLTGRARAADLEVDYLPMYPGIESGRGLVSALPVLRSRAAAGRIVPEHTMAVLDEWDLQVESDPAPRLVRT